jgi:hypothetical protein
MCTVAGLLGRLASESGRLRQGEETHGLGGRDRRASMLAILRHPGRRRQRDEVAVARTCLVNRGRAMNPDDEGDDPEARSDGRGQPQGHPDSKGNSD